MIDLFLQCVLNALPEQVRAHVLLCTPPKLAHRVTTQCGHLHHRTQIVLTGLDFSIAIEDEHFVVNPTQGSYNFTLHENSKKVDAWGTTELNFLLSSVVKSISARLGIPPDNSLIKKAIDRYYTARNDPEYNGYANNIKITEPA